MHQFCSALHSSCVMHQFYSALHSSCVMHQFCSALPTAIFTHPLRSALPTSCVMHQFCRLTPKRKYLNVPAVASELHNFVEYKCFSQLRKPRHYIGYCVPTAAVSRRGFNHDEGISALKPVPPTTVKVCALSLICGELVQFCSAVSNNPLLVTESLGNAAIPALTGGSDCRLIAACRRLTNASRSSSCSP